MSIHKPYFAENPEAHFGNGAFHPSDRADLKHPDAERFDLLPGKWARKNEFLTCSL